MSAAIQSYRDLRVWQRALQLAAEIYRLTDRLPAAERYGLSAQLRRAAVSVMSNIAEGHERGVSRGRGDFRHFVSIARGSAAEIEAQLALCGELGFLDEDEIRGALGLTDACSRMLAALHRRLAEGEGLPNRAPRPSPRAPGPPP